MIQSCTLILDLELVFCISYHVVAITIHSQKYMVEHFAGHSDSLNAPDF